MSTNSSESLAPPLPPAGGNASSSSAVGGSVVSVDVKPPPPHSGAAGMGSTNFPRVTYRELIIRAIREAPEKQLSVKAIFKYIEQHHDFHKTRRREPSWKASVRCVLSSHKCFRCIPENAGTKGRYWTLSDANHAIAAAAGGVAAGGGGAQPLDAANSTAPKLEDKSEFPDQLAAMMQ